MRLIQAIGVYEALVEFGHKRVLRIKGSNSHIDKEPRKMLTIAQILKSQ